MAEKFIVITADIIDSKKNLQNMSMLENLIETLNRRFENDLVAYFKAYRGDEIQCVLLQSKNIFKIMRNLRYIMKPLRLRIGIGKGYIDNGVLLDNNKLENINPWENNGQAFYFARDALACLTNNRHYRKKPRTYFLSEDKDNSIINAMLNLYDIILESWTMSQWDSVVAYEECQSLEKAALFLAKKYQSVQRSVSEAYWEEINLCEEKLIQLIEQN